MKKRMQISIDTTKDSHDDIRKAISLLQGIVGAGPVRTNSPDIFANPVPGESSVVAAPASPSLFNMFDAAPSQPVSQAAPADEDKPDDQPVLELY